MGILRSVGAVLAGLLVGMIAISAVHFLSGLIYPRPAVLDFNDKEKMADWVAGLPAGAYLFALAAHAAGPFVGGWLAAVLAGRAKVVHALIIGALFLLGSVLNMFLLPHPPWFAVVDLLLYLPAAYLGARLAGGSPRPRAEPAPA